MYSRYVITFDEKGEWSSGNDLAINVIIFRVYNSSSSHTDNLKNNFLILGESTTLVSMEALVYKKKRDINSSKVKSTFCLSLHYNSGNNYLFVNWKEICQFKASNGNVNFPSRFCLGSISNKFDYVISEELSFEESVYDFWLIMVLMINLTYETFTNVWWLKIVYKKFGLIKNVFIVVLSIIVNAFNHTKCFFISNQKCIIQPTLINLHPNEYNQEFHYYPFAVKVDRCVGSFNI